MNYQEKFKDVSTQKLIGKTALVTGARRGTGRACAEMLISMGADVLALDLVEIDDFPEAKTLQVDVSDEKRITQVIKEGINGQPFQIVVNNAAAYKTEFFEEHTTQTWDRMYAVNVTAQFYILRAAARELIRKKLPGAFINVSSIAGTHSHVNNAGYCSSKAASLGLTRSAALDLIQYGITVNSVCPGTVDTKMIRGLANDLMEILHTDWDGAWKYLVDQIPTRRMQQPWNIAMPIVFLATMGARSVNGAQIVVDSGTTAHAFFNFE